MRVAGFHCTKDAAFVAVADGDTVVDGMVERVRVAGNLEGAAAIIAMVDDVEDRLAEIKPERVVVVLREPTYQASHGQLIDQISIETAVRLAAHRRGIGSELLARPTVRTRLGLARRGSLESHAAEVTPTVGRYWSTGRAAAALGALAGAKG
jgi:hypothetical protein